MAVQKTTGVCSNAAARQPSAGARSSRDNVCLRAAGSGSLSFEFRVDRLSAPVTMRPDRWFSFQTSCFGIPVWSTECGLSVDLAIRTTNEVRKLFLASFYIYWQINSLFSANLLHTAINDRLLASSFPDRTFEPVNSIRMNLPQDHTS